MLPTYTLLHVADPQVSAGFYGRLLDREPVENHPTFVSFELTPGTMLGLWSRQTLTPASAPSGGFEIGFQVAGDVDETFRAWQATGMTMLQPPTDLDFGRTFVGLDPDGHRLRVFAPGTEDN